MRQLVLALALSVAPLGATQQPQTAFTIGGGQTVMAEAGEFTVPRQRSAPQGARLTLRFVRFRSTAATPAPPIVFLAGGPGDAATRAFHGMPRAILESLTSIADVIAFDQRGTGTSDPSSVQCAPIGGMAMAAPLEAPLDPTQLSSVLRAQLAACLAQSSAAGFTTTESAEDIKGLSTAIGAPRVQLLAGSYGTHLALETARRHPQTIAAMALLGVEGPDDTMKLPSRVDGVLAELDRQYPGLIASVRTLKERLNKEPWTKTLPNGQRVTVGVWDLQRRISDALDSTTKIAALPSALAEMMAGDYSDLVRWTIAFRSAKPLNLMHVAMDCASFASPARLQQIASEARTSLLGDAINFPMPALCETPGLPRLPDAFRAPVTSAVPALLVAGTFDGRTPPANAEAIARGLSRSRTLIIPGASHGLFQETAAMSAVTQLFGSIR